MSIKLEEQDEVPRRDGSAPGPARVPAPGPRASRAFAPGSHSPVPAPAPNHDAPAAGGAGGSKVTIVKEEEAEETLGQQRDRLALAQAHGPVRVDAHIKVEDSTSGEDTDRDEEGGEEVEGQGGEGGDGEQGSEGLLGGEVGLVLLVGLAHVPGGDGDCGGGPRRSTPADRAARAKRGRGDVAAADDVPVAPALKRQRGGVKVGPSGRHGVSAVTGTSLRKHTPWLKWRVALNLPGNSKLELGLFSTADDGARAYDAEVRRRGWAHVRAINFPLPEELAASASDEERCDERGLPLSLAPEPPAAAHGSSAAQGASGQSPPKLSANKPGKSGFFGVTKRVNNNNRTPWRAKMSVSRDTYYEVGYFATKQEAARAYDAEVRRRGWVHLKRLNFPDPADDAPMLPSSAAAGAPGPE